MELLTVILIVGALLAVLLPALSRTRERGQRLACLINVQQLALGSILYADEDPDGNFIGAQIKDTDLNWLYRKQVPELRTYACPSTRNRVRPEAVVSSSRVLVDLIDTATYTESVGISYRVIPSFGRPGAAVAKTQASVLNYAHQRSAFGMKGWIPGPSQVWLYADSDKRRPGVAGSIANWPDASDNHAATGGNVGFSDGHAEFVPQRDYFYRYELSQDEGYMKPSER